ncbi:SIR2 family NAD-dependent protein deacylase [Parvicella tangerina]|uniref:protein acetyllysine N-acetyltransferase n=1 Tax=Parvicella tangerina TaxID=2829795 RepID=A0A916JKS1_9FLAO|nr:Sir2 family NAD-dependent protein deacetylase [Parvicella tangerina]CAG5077452.1 NAD-dependent protein deacylase [Parvicella tangerina]
MKKLVVFTGAGISQESGIKTFRDADGLWEEYDIEEVASIQAWHKNPALVLDFYNKRRHNALEAQPNKAHEVIGQLEDYFDVQVVTQNIDNLHERAGSTKVLHLHGMIDMAKSDVTGEQICLNGKDISIGDVCSEGHQLRPDIVWFGEEVPNIPIAADLIREADAMLIVGTSLNVYPAAGLVHVAPENSLKYLVDPNLSRVGNIKRLKIINEKATIGVPIAANSLIELLG